MCPVCREALHLTEKTWSCVNKHSYDVAKQGYVNLHVVQHKHSKNPGDTVESVQARRAFLSAGFYAPLQHAVVTKIAELKINNLLDIGCGEGYYTNAMQAEVVQCVGVDIAKNAVQVAAKLNKKVTWVVGTGATLPVLDASIDLCTSLFSPIPKQEILQFFNENNQFSLNMMKSVCGDLKDADDHMVNMAQKTVRQRLVETLIYLEETFGKNEDGSLHIQLSREELAGMIGTATESCIRLLSELNKSELIELSGKKIFIADKNKLKRFA